MGSHAYPSFSYAVDAVKIAFVADVHLANHRQFGGVMHGGLNARSSMIRDVLAKVKERVNALDVDEVVVLGDLVDVANPTPQILTVAHQFCWDLDYAGVNVTLLMGNHDQSSLDQGDHALGPLERSAKIVESPISWPFRTRKDSALPNVCAVLVPFRPGDARDWLPSMLASVRVKEDMPRILCLHLGLIDGDTPPWLRDAPDAVPVASLEKVVKTYGFDAVFAGNWHRHKRWGNIVQVGTLCPTGFDNPGTSGYGTLVVYDSAKLPGARISVEEIPGPRFVTTVHEAQLLRARGFEHVFLRAECDTPTERDAVRAEAMLIGVEGLDVVGDRTEDRAAARGAAAGARSAKTLDDALSAYVAAMPLGNPLYRWDVLERSRKLLGL